MRLDSNPPKAEVVSSNLAGCANDVKDLAEKASRPAGPSKHIANRNGIGLGYQSSAECQICWTLLRGRPHRLAPEPGTAPISRSDCWRCSRSHRWQCPTRDTAIIHAKVRQRYSISSRCRRVFANVDFSRSDLPAVRKRRLDRLPPARVATVALAAGKLRRVGFVEFPLHCELRRRGRHARSRAPGMVSSSQVSFVPVK